MSYWNRFSDRIRRRLAPHYWDGNFHWKPQHQLVYAPDETRPEFIPFTAPYVCAAAPYDNLGFWDYPARVGWRVHRHDRQCHSGQCPPGNCVVPSEPSDIPPFDTKRSHYGLQTPAVSRFDGSMTLVAEKIAFLQAWLFFGALAEVCSLCGLALDLNKAFVSGDTVNTAALNGLPRRLFAASQMVRLAGTRELRVRLYAVVRQVQLMITRDGWEDEHEYTFLECKVLCTLYILLRVLSLTFLCNSPHWNLDPKDDMKISVGDLVHDWKPEGQTRMRDLTWSRLMEIGWCKSELHLLHGDDELIFSSFLERPGAPQDHTNCTETRCMAYQTDENNYKTAHVSAHCNCESVSVDPERLRDALAASRIPKILISQDLQLSVVGYDCPYIAISHVWADGLGNPLENSLPRCQLQRLRDLATKLHKTHLASGHQLIALWIDTLCIPVAAHLKEYRKLAIRFLGRTFHEATAVLVLDRELCLFESQKASIFEVGVRITYSGWMKRLWTLQEAALAVESPNSHGKMYFQMGDGPVLWNRFSQTFQHKPSRARPKPAKPSALTITVHDVKSNLLFEFGVVVSMSGRLPSVHDLQKLGLDTQFQKLSRAVQTRSTSKPEDEPICLASLIGLDVADILSVQTAPERMARFYLLLREIPTAIIFAQLGVEDPHSQNMQDAPFRWAPRSLLLLAQPMNIDMAYGAQRFSEAVHRTYGICEADGLHIEHGGFVFREEAMLRKTCTLEDTDSGAKYCLTWYGEAPDCPHRNVALIFETVMCSNVAIICIEDHRGVSDDAEFYATIVGHGYVEVRETPAKGEVIRGVLTRSTQKWCLT